LRSCGGEIDIADKALVPGHKRRLYISKRGRVCEQRFLKTLNDAKIPVWLLMCLVWLSEIGNSVFFRVRMSLFVEPVRNEEMVRRRKLGKNEERPAFKEQKERLQRSK
jgi:hypothetical protein